MAVTLFIGGPLDGQRLETGEARQWRSLEAFPLPRVSREPQVTATLSYINYRLEWLACADENEKRWSEGIFIRDGLSTAAALRKLLEHYRSNDRRD